MNKTSSNGHFLTHTSLKAFHQHNKPPTTAHKAVTMFMRQSSFPGSKRRRNQATVQGTQAVAAAQLESNAKFFEYPSSGFVSPIEHSLLYAMILEPTVYPAEVILQAIREQDFAEFLEVKPDKQSSTRAQQDGEPTASYAQLSAILSLAMQKWPDEAEKSDAKDMNDTDRIGNNASNNTTVPQVLCQALIRTVVRYASDHDLDRSHEINELLRPAVERTRQNMGKAMNTKFVLPYLAGAALSIATGNPLPLYVAYTGGMMSYLNDNAVTQEKEHAVKVHQASQRAANVETASLMEEAEHDP